MKITKQDKENLLTLINHSRQDIEYGGGGTFSKGDPDDTFDSKEAKKVQKAIELISRIILIN